MPLFGRLRHSGVLWRKQAEQMSRFDVLTAWNKYKEKQCASDTSDRLAAVSNSPRSLALLFICLYIHYTCASKCYITVFSKFTCTCSIFSLVFPCRKCCEAQLCLCVKNNVKFFQ